MQLHIVEELFELFGIDAGIDTSPTPEPGASETVMAISRTALSGGVSAKAFQLRAWIQGHEVLVLVDSGSTTSFLDQTLAKSLDGVTSLARACTVRVADGGELTCSFAVPQCTWYSQGHEFTTNMKVLPLGTYDAILGMDWLEENSPMFVDWRAKRIEIHAANATICLQGHDAQSTVRHTISSLHLQSLINNEAVTHVIFLHSVTSEEELLQAIPDCIRHVLLQFEDVFGEPTELPPWHSCDHRIPLIPGAQPVNIRPYEHKLEH